MATVVRTEGGADAKVEWLRVLAAATGGDKAPRVKVADYFGSAADAWAENQKRLNVVAASHRFSSGGGGGDDAPAGERTSSSPAGSPEKPASPPKRGSIVDRRGSVRGSAVGGSTAARDPDEALASVAEGAKLNASGEAAAAQAAYERALGLAGYARDLHAAAARRSLRALRAGEHRRGGGRRGGGGGAVRRRAGDCAEGVCSAGEAAARVGEVAGREARRGRPHLCRGESIAAASEPANARRTPPPSGPPALLRNPHHPRIPPHTSGARGGRPLHARAPRPRPLLDARRRLGGRPLRPGDGYLPRRRLGRRVERLWCVSTLRLSVSPPSASLLPVSLSPTCHDCPSSSPLRRLPVRVGAARRGVRVLLPSAAPPPRPRSSVRQSGHLPQGAGKAR